MAKDDEKKKNENKNFDDMSLDDDIFGSLEDDLDFGESGFDMDAESNRDPYNDFNKQFKKEFTNSFLDRGVLRRLISAALPKGYSQAYNAYDSVTNGIHQIYNENQSELNPLLRRANKLTERLSPSISKFIPSPLKALFKNADTEELPSEYQESPLDRNINGIDDLLKYQVHKDATSSVLDTERDYRSTKLSATALSINADTNKLLGRLVTYQDTATISYQRKSLELKYRQLDVITKLYNTSTIYYTQAVELLKAIGHNVALPDVSKMNGSEYIKQQLKNRLASSVINSASNFAAGRFDRIRKNISSAINGALGNANFAVDSIPDGLAESGFNPTANFAGGTAAQLAEYAIKEALEKLKLGDIPFIKAGGFALQDTLTGVSQKFNDYARSYTESTGVRGYLEDLLKQMMDSYSITSEVKGKDILSLDTPDIITKQFTTTVIDIIPGYLASIDKHIRALTTGTAQQEHVYSHYSGGFVTRDTLNKENFELGVKGGAGDTVRTQLDQLVADMGAEDISPEAKRALRARLMLDMSSDSAFDPRRYTDIRTWSQVDPTVGDEISDFFSKQYGIDSNNEYDKNAAAEIKEHRARVNNVYTELQSRITDYSTRLAGLSEVLGRRTFRDMGLSTYNGKGGDAINTMALFDKIVNESGDDFTAKSKLYDKPKEKEKNGFFDDLDAEADHLRREIAKQKAKEEREKALAMERARTLTLDVDKGDVYPQGTVQPTPTPTPVDIPTPIQNITVDNKDIVEAIQNLKLQVPDLLSTKDDVVNASILKVYDLLVDQHKDLVKHLKNGLLRQNDSNDTNKSDQEKPKEKPRLRDRIIDGGVDLTVGLAKNVVDLLTSYFTWSYKTIGKGLLSGVGLAYKGISSLFVATDSLGVQDIYVTGSNQPALTAKGIRNGEYYDFNTKKLIRSLKDITGPVVTANGQYRITQEEFDKGLFNGKGESVAGYLGRHIFNGLRHTASLGINYFTGSYGLIFKGMSFIGNLAVDQFTQYDAYFPGEDTPRITSRLLKQGYYRDEKGEPILSLKDIKGVVFDPSGQIVISKEDWEKYKSLYTRNGSLLFTIGRGVIKVSTWALDKAKYATGWYLDKAMSIYKGIYNLGKHTLTGIGTFLTRGFGGFLDDTDKGKTAGILEEQLKVQKAIFEQLRAITPEKLKWDLDKDGDVDNSWEDILKRRRSNESPDAATEDGESKQKTSLFGKNPVVDAISSLGKRLEKALDKLGDRVEESNEDGLLDQAADISDVLGGKDKRGRRRPPKGGTGKPGMWSKIGRGIATATGYAWSAARVLGTGAMTVLGSPIALGVIAVSAAVYGGYTWYKSSQAKDRPVTYLRLTQYGIDPTDEDRVKKIFALETVVGKAITWTNDTPYVDPSKIQLSELISIFEIEQGDQEHLNTALKWFTNRFRPVYLAHVKALHDISTTATLEDVDKVVTGSNVKAFVKTVDIRNFTHVYNNTSVTPFKLEYFGFVGKLDTDAGDVADAIKLVFEKIPPADKVDVTTKPVTKGDLYEVSKLATKLAVAPMAAIEAASLNTGKKNTSISEGLVSAVVKPPKVTDISAYKAKRLDLPDNLDIPTAVRYLQYGLKTFNKDRVDQLRTLEDIYIDAIRFSGTDSATIDGDIDDLEDTAFSTLKVEAKDRGACRTWLRQRFVPTLLAYALAVRKRWPSDIRIANRNLPQAVLRDILVEMSLAKNEDGSAAVWSIGTSPWTDMTIGTDASIIVPYLDSLSKRDKELDVIGMRKITPYSRPSVLPQVDMGDTDVPGDKSNRIGSASNVVDMMTRSEVTQGNGMPLPTPDTGGISTGKPNMGGEGPVGATVTPPSGGSGGDISQLPMSTGKGWKAMKDIIVGAAKIVGFDPVIGATTAAVESKFDPKAGAGTSSAKGLFQFIDETWQTMLDRYGKTYGIAPNTSPYDARANAILGMRYLKNNYEYLKHKVPGRPIDDVSLYAAHFLGPYGAKQLLTAPLTAPSSTVVSAKSIRANKSVFYENGALRTVGGVLSELDHRLKSMRRLHDLSPGGNYEVAKTDPNVSTGVNPPVPTPTPPTTSAINNVTPPTPTAPTVNTVANSVPTPSTSVNTASQSSPPSIPTVSKQVAAMKAEPVPAPSVDMSDLNNLNKDQLDTQRLILSELTNIKQLLSTKTNTVASADTTIDATVPGTSANGRGGSNTGPAIRNPIDTKRRNAVT